MMKRFNSKDDLIQELRERFGDRKAQIEYFPGAGPMLRIYIHHPNGSVCVSADFSSISTSERKQ